MSEVYFPSMQDLEACLNSPGGQETAQHAVDISTESRETGLIAAGILCSSPVFLAEASRASFITSTLEYRFSGS